MFWYFKKTDLKKMYLNILIFLLIFTKFYVKVSIFRLIFHHVFFFCDTNFSVLALGICTV